ncbi:MAG: PLP-dependent transferase, partial [Ignavibacteriaceae bacterium]|nr:PLP-dependent transferase [Ignavibacteriaceae bacterium]
LICHPVTMTHASMNPELREKAGINERVIRLSVGIESAKDLIEDLDKALQFSLYEEDAKRFELGYNLAKL